MIFRWCDRAVKFSGGVDQTSVIHGAWRATERIAMPDIFSRGGRAAPSGLASTCIAYYINREHQKRQHQMLSSLFCWCNLYRYRDRVKETEGNFELKWLSISFEFRHQQLVQAFPATYKTVAVLKYSLLWVFKVQTPANGSEFYFSIFINILITRLFSRHLFSLCKFKNVLDKKAPA